MDLLVIHKEHLIESLFDDNKGFLLRINSTENVKKITWNEIWENFLPDFLNQDFINKINTEDKVKISKYLESI
jgi:hypothetical protein